MAFKGSWVPTKPEKYLGDPHNITYRSLWEKKAFEWCDRNPDVKYWESEETVIPYRCKTDGEMHRYFMDLRIIFRSGKTLLVEIKPEYQTKPPKRTKGKKEKTFITEAMTYAKNISKWQAAEAFAKKKGWSFQIWGETALESIGIKILNRRRNTHKAKRLNG